MTGRRVRLAAGPVALVLLAGCTSFAGEEEDAHAAHTTAAPSSSVSPSPSTSAAPPAPVIDVLPGMPAVVDPANVYSETAAGMLTPAAAAARPLVYVPHSGSGEVRVIDTIYGHFAGLGVYEPDIQVIDKTLGELLSRPA